MTNGERTLMLGLLFVTLLITIPFSFFAFYLVEACVIAWWVRRTDRKKMRG